MLRVYRAVRCQWPARVKANRKPTTRPCGANDSALGLCGYPCARDIPRATMAVASADHASGELELARLVNF